MIVTHPVGPGTARVTFSLRYGVGPHDICVVGDFNGWSRTAHPMTADGYGMYMAEVLVPTGRVYRFRYLVDGLHWQIDWAAKAHQPNEIGGHDSLLDLTETQRPVAPPQPRWIAASRSAIPTI